MSKLLTPHPDHEILLRLLDEDLEGAERRLVDERLKDCALCQREMEEVREAVNDYQQFHGILKAGLPSPPKPWDRLDILAARRRPQPARVFTMTPRRWLAVAAGIAALILGTRIFQPTPGVKAAELLRKAAAAEKTAPARARSIRMKSRKFQWDRPRRLPGRAEAIPAGASEMRHLLESAGYSWDDPLSADSYSRWHDGLATKEDLVETSSEAYVIHTSAAGNPISDATLTLASDLHAMTCTLQFGAAETLEVSEIQEDKPESPAGSPHAVPPPVHSPTTAPPTHLAGPADELQVLSALHGIGADLGEPIDVKRDGAAVVVSVTGLNPQRQEAVKAALSRLPAVRLQFGEFENRANKELTIRPTPQVDTANPLLVELESASPDGLTASELADQITDNTERALERVYAVRSLARRFSPEIEAQMAPADVATLHAMVRDHAAVIATSTTAIARLLQPLLPRVAGVAPPEGSWQSSGEVMLADVRRLDQALNAGARGASLEGRKRAAGQALADLNQRLTRMP